MTPDHIIGITGGIISLGGLVFSVLAYREAKSAKKAATKAGQGVKRQSIALEVAEICEKCKIDFGVSYTGVRQSYDQVNNEIQRISGLYASQELQDATCKKIIDEEISATLSQIKLKLNALNPGAQENTQQQTASDDKFYYYQFSENFGALSGNLNKLRGALESQLMATN